MSFPEKNNVASFRLAFRNISVKNEAHRAGNKDSPGNIDISGDRNCPNLPFKSPSMMICTIGSTIIIPTLSMTADMSMRLNTRRTLFLLVANT